MSTFRTPDFLKVRPALRYMRVFSSARTLLLWQHLLFEAMVEPCSIDAPQGPLEMQASDCLIDAEALCHSLKWPPHILQKTLRQLKVYGMITLRSERGLCIATIVDHRYWTGIEG